MAIVWLYQYFTVPLRFVVNLFCGPHNGDEIALHVSVRFNEDCIVRNSRTYAGWGAEERLGPHFPFIREQNFEILILCDPTDFKVRKNPRVHTVFKGTTVKGVYKYNHSWLTL